jgi:type IV pilus assembly protein PilY1
MSVKKLIMAALIIGLCLAGGISRADDEALFATELAPDALIILDLSGSMAQNPAGGSNTYGNSSCNGTFYSNSGSGHTTDCSKLAIAKRSIFSILDDTGDGYIKADDETSLNVRIGYMRYYNGDDQAGNYSSGNNKLSKAIGTSYRSIFCNTSNSSGCSISSTCSYSCSSSTACVNSECANSGTPLAAALNEAKLYLDASKAADTTAGSCRQKFAIVITDGADTYACSGDGTETQADMYKRRRATVAAAKALGDAGYTLFVIGFGSAMPAYLQNTLNWMAYYGGTENPLVANSGDTSAFNPSGITTTSCESSTTTGNCDGNHTDCYATSNDPGNLSLSGYAFIASDADEIANELQIAFNVIRQANYSFSQSSIQLNRTTDENFIYEGSFQPVTGDPFWLGHLKKYDINTNGTIGNEEWDAGTVLMNTAASARNIKTYKVGALIAFTTANLTNSDLAVTSDTSRTQVVGYFRGESAYNQDNWKLGDIFRSKPITVGTPSKYYEDPGDTNSAFDTFRTNHTRSTSPYAGRLVLVGANDGQLHAFQTNNGSEAWSFIPPNQLSRLKLIAHVTEPTTLTHVSYIDGPLTVADAWVPTTSNSGTTKSASDWQTVLLFGEGQGVGTNVWSSSQYCDSGFNTTYSSTYQYFCGYYCLNVTNTLSPTTCGPTSGTPWLHLTIDSARAPYIGAPWSTPMIGKVMVGGNEKWVAVIGGGKTLSGAANSGKGLFVINLIDGSLLWSYTYADNTALNYPMPAAPAIVDTDNDGFIDTVYIGDLGGNMWRFKFCRATDGTSCSTSSWTGGLFFQANSSSGTRPIYDPSVAIDSYKNIWVYWGTGDKTDPTSTTYQEKFFALKDTDRTSTRTISDMMNITSSTSTYDGSGYGFYLNLTGTGEKILSDTTVYGGVTYFTTFTPASTTDLCVQGGTAKLYAINYTTGAAALNVIGSTSLTRSMTIGTGIPSSPVISIMDGSTTPDLYVTTSGGGGVESVTERANVIVNSLTNRTNMIFWKDKRLE